MTFNTINEKSEITLFFAIKTIDDEIVDSNFNKSPATFKYSDGSLLPGFEKVLLGLKEGDKKEFLIPYKNGFGEINSKNIQNIAKDKFKDILLENGILVIFQDPSGYEKPGVVKKVLDKFVTIDFNHPLAGRDVLFEIEIVRVR